MRGYQVRQDARRRPPFTAGGAMSDDLQPGDPRLIGPYRLRGVLGAGAMGRVFLGASADGRLVAVKVIHAGLATDPAFRARFRREIEVAREVSGPFTAPLIDADVDGPVPWLATAYVAGPSLADLVAEGGPMPPGAVLELAAGLAEGLTAIHAAGVVHRDLKPSNILLAPDGPRLIDFGVSRAFGTAALTDTGLMVGSPGFMSPEQAEGLPVGPPSDIFSLGAVLAFAATGQGPFGPGSTAALLYRVVHRPADLSQVPGEVRGLIERCLVKDPALRPAARDLLIAAGPGRPAPMTATGADRTVPLAVSTLMPPDLPLSLGTWKPVPAVPRRDRPARRRQDRPSWRRHWRSLSGAAIIAALLGAAAGLVLTATPDPAPAVQSQRPVAAPATPAPGTFAPLPSADPRPSRPGARKTSLAASSPTRTARPVSSVAPAGTTPLAEVTSPTDMNPSTDATSPTVSSPRPSARVSPTHRPHPSVSPSPSPSAPPTSSSAGYGY
jgi:eukaryotic-like serine/threonine-protein kinase